jgi:hypothetical protein
MSAMTTVPKQTPPLAVGVESGHALGAFDAGNNIAVLAIAVWLSSAAGVVSKFPGLKPTQPKQPKRGRPHC